MCGRYYVDDEVLEEVEKLIRQIDAGFRSERSKQEVFPTEQGLVMFEKEHKAGAGSFGFGWPGFQGKGLMINARAESVLEKNMFRDSVLQRRCVIPARHFYEWDRMKNKVTFLRGDQAVIFMAGFYKQYEGGNQFIILTTKANPSVAAVHDRMPLILERSQIEPWILDRGKTEDLLYQTPVPLEKQYDYYQPKFDFLV